jgi:iron complex outermembrane receptor protein
VNGQEVLTGGNTEVPIPNANGYTTVESPSETAYLAATYSIPFVAGKLELNANGSYNSGYYWNPDNRIKQPAYALLNAYAKWTTSSGLWDVQFWGNNVTGKQYYSYESAYALGNIGSAAAPATYGIRAGVHF